MTPTTVTQNAAATGPNPEVAKPKEVAEFLHTTEGSLAQDRHAGRGVPYIKHGRRVLYRWDDVAAYLESNRVDPGAR